MEGKKVIELLNRLTAMLLPGERVAGFMKFVMKIVSSRLPRQSFTEKEVKEEILKRLDEGAAKRFQGLYLDLIRCKALAKRTQCLTLLAKLQEFKIKDVYFAKPEKPIGSEIANRIDIRNNESVRVMQEELITDIFLVLYEQEANYLKFAEDSEEISVNEVKTLRPYQHMTQEIIELAVLSKKVIRFAESNQVSRTCKLLQGICSNEITAYREMIDWIKTSEKLNIRKIHFWSAEAVERMTWLSILAESAFDLRGSQVISAIYNLSSTGNVAVKEMMLGILQQVSSSLVGMIFAWVTHGELDDPFNEFFIGENMLVDENDLWHKRYSILQDMVPCFFKPQLLNAILLIGKSINFIKICCKESWVPQASDPIFTGYGNSEMQGLPSITDLETLESWIQKLSTLTNQYLLQLVNIKYNLELHFLSLKKYLLMAQGDFHHILMRSLIDLLSNNSNTIYKHELNSLLEGAIRDSNSKFDDIECLNRLDTKVLEPSPLDTGWDVFVLTYNFSPPLTTIFTSEIMEIYLRSFKFLWQIKRAHYLMSSYSNWKEMIIYQSYDELRQVFHVFQLLKSEIVHFISNLMSYFIVEVVEASWNRFNTKIGEAKSFDEIIEVQNKFLAEVVDKSFLNDEGVYKRIMGVVDICVRFYNLQGQLLQAAIEERNRRELYIRIGTFEELQVFDELLCDINLIKQQFYEEFRGFRDQLTSNHLKYLQFRLDFNEYYEIKQLQD